MIPYLICEHGKDTETFQHGALRCNTHRIAKLTPRVNKRGDESNRSTYTVSHARTRSTLLPCIRWLPDHDHQGLPYPCKVSNETVRNLEITHWKKQQVTLPKKFRSLFHDGPMLVISVGAKVFALKFSTSNTLFDSRTTFPNSIDSSNLTFHSNRAWADSAYRPPTSIIAVNRTKLYHSSVVDGIGIHMEGRTGCFQRKRTERTPAQTFLGALAPMRSLVVTLFLA